MRSGTRTALKARALALKLETSTYPPFPMRSISFVGSIRQRPMSLLKEYCFVNRIRCIPKQIRQRTMRAAMLSYPSSHAGYLRAKVKSRESHDLQQWSYAQYFKRLMRWKRSLPGLTRTSYRASYYPFLEPKSFGYSYQWYRPVLPCLKRAPEPPSLYSRRNHTFGEGWIWWINRRPMWSVGRYRKPVYLSLKRPVTKVFFQRNRARIFRALNLWEWAGPSLYPLTR